MVQYAAKNDWENRHIEGYGRCHQTYTNVSITVIASATDRVKVSTLFGEFRGKDEASDDSYCFSSTDWTTATDAAEGSVSIQGRTVPSQARGH